MCGNLWEKVHTLCGGTGTELTGVKKCSRCKKFHGHQNSSRKFPLLSQCGNNGRELQNCMGASKYNGNLSWDDKNLKMADGSPSH